ncbi:MAG: hypothetical protein QM802_16835 [Agriterribacter sp.]
MKPRSFFSAARKSVIAIAVAVITLPAVAGTIKKVDPVEETAAVKYIGSEAQTMLFNVKYNNATASKFIVTIKDQDGITLFQSSFTDVVFDKKFSLPKGTDASKIVFTISDKKNNYSESFEISTQTRVVEDVVVKKVN